LSYDKVMKHKQHCLLVVLVIFLIIVVFFVVLNIANAGKINRGMKIGNISVGGLDNEKTQEKLASAVQQFLNQDFYLNYKQLKWKVNLKNLGIEIDVPKTINLALERGHQKNFLINSWWQMVSLFGYNLTPLWQLNEEKMELFLRNNLFLIHQPAKDATLVFNKEKNEFIVTSSKQGIIINKKELFNNLSRTIKTSKITDIKLSLINDYPEVLESETEIAHQKAETLIKNASIKLFAEEEKDKKEIDIINQEGILNLIEFKPVPEKNKSSNKILGAELDAQKIENYLISISPLINHEPIDAQLAIKDGRVITFALSQDGIKLDLENNIDILNNGILNGEKEIILKVTRIKPKITTESIDNLGITALLSRGISNFSGSSASRIHNIKIGAAKFNGVLLMPEEKFSFNTILGDIGPEQGYEPGLVIKKDKMVAEYGGGLCQVSTTTFRAAILAGLEITERYPHAFPVKYYNPQGFDATIYPPSPDLKFINNTPANILIQTKVSGYELIFEFYGTEDERRVEIDGPYQYDIKEDGSMKAKFTQKVYDKNNNLIINKTFYSVYKSPSLFPEEKNPLQ